MIINPYRLFVIINISLFLLTNAYSQDQENQNSQNIPSLGMFKDKNSAKPTSEEAFLDYAQLRRTFTPGHCGFPVKYMNAQINKKSPDRLREKAFHYYLGSLGLKALMHDRTYYLSGGHRSIFPVSLIDKNGKLAYSCFEVTQVLPASPAEGKIQIGDLIFMVNGQVLKTGKEMFPDAKYAFMRQLVLHMAELLDESEEKGFALLKVLRPPKGMKLFSDQTITKVLHHFKGSGEQKIPVKDIKTISITNSDINYSSYKGDTVWVNPRFSGPKGDLPLKDLNWQWKGAPEEFVKFGNEEGKNIITLKENTALAYQVPEGYDSFKVSVQNSGNSNNARIETELPVKWTSKHKSYVKDIKVSVPRYGKLSSTFPDNCKKADRLARENVNFMLKYQEPDGSWNRWGGQWTNGAFDTAFIGLALLSMGDETLLPNIRKAAYYVAMRSAEGWSCVEGMKMMFVSEYYLRTKDSKVLPYLQLYIDRAQNSLMGDYYIGHKYHNPGYNGKGMSVGFGYVLLGLSVASKTDARVNIELLDKMHETCARIAAVNGGLPYGRFWIPGKIPTVPWNAAARTGPALAAAIIHGGHKSFMVKAMNMFKLTFGAVEKVHATPSMGFFGANLAFGLADRDFFLRSMQYYKWKFIMNRSPHAGVLLQPQNMHRATGEGPLGKWWRMAATTVLLNAGKKNLAITGKQEFIADKFKNYVVPNSYETQVFSKYKNDWTVAELSLKDKCPAELKKAAVELRNMKVDKNITDNFFKVLKESAVTICRKIHSQNIDPRTKAYAIELILGLDHHISVKKGYLWMNSYLPFYHLKDLNHPEIPAFLNKYARMNGHALFADKAGKKVKFDLNTVPPEQWAKYFAWFKSSSPFIQSGMFSVPCNFEYEVCGLKIKYARDIIFNNDKNESGLPSNVLNHRAIPINGKLLKGGTSNVQSIVLSNGYKIDVLVPEGIDMLDPLTLGGFPALKGDSVKVEYCSNMLNPMYRRIKILNTKYTARKAYLCKAVNNSNLPSDSLKAFFDGDTAKDVVVNSRTLILDFTFKSPQPISYVLVNGKRLARHEAQGMHNGKWHDMAYFKENKVKIDRVRVTVTSKYPKMVLNEIIFSGMD